MNETKPVCFVAMPFGKAGTALRMKYDSVYDHVIRMPVEEAGFHCDRADKIPGTGDIVDMLKSKLVTAALVVVDLSDRNPNVFYELGFRHALDKPTITIANTNEIENIGLPFNINHYNTIAYELSDIVSVDTCRANIKGLATSFYRALDVGADRTSAGKAHEPTLADLEQKLEIGLGNIHQVVSEMAPSRPVETEGLLQKFVSSVDLLSGQAEGIKELRSQLSQITQSSTFAQQADTLGVVSI